MDAGAGSLADDQQARVCSDLHDRARAMREMDGAGVAGADGFEQGVEVFDRCCFSGDPCFWPPCSAAGLAGLAHDNQYGGNTAGSKGYGTCRFHGAHAPRLVALSSIGARDSVALESRVRNTRSRTASGTAVKSRQDDEMCSGFLPWPRSKPGPTSASLESLDMTPLLQPHSFSRNLFPLPCSAALKRFSGKSKRDRDVSVGPIHARRWILVDAPTKPHLSRDETARVPFNSKLEIPCPLTFSRLSA